VLRNISIPGGLSANSLAPEVDLAGKNMGNSLAIGDLDGDGRLDLVTGTYMGKVLSLYRNLSAPDALTPSAFGPELLFEVNNRVNHVALGDLGGEGKPTVAVVTELASQLKLYRNLSTEGGLTNASLGSPITLPTGWNAGALAIGDLDGDGRPDLVVANSYDCTISIYHNVTPLQTGGRQAATDSMVSTNSSAVGVTGNLLPGER